MVERVIVKNFLIIFLICSWPLYSIDFVDSITIYHPESNQCLSIIDDVNKAHEVLGVATNIHVVERNYDSKWDFIHEYWQKEGIIISYMRGFQDQILQITIISDKWKIGNRFNISNIDKNSLLNYFDEEYFLQFSENYGFILFSKYIEDINIAYTIRFNFDDDGNFNEVRIINENEEFAGFELPSEVYNIVTK